MMKRLYKYGTEPDEYPDPRCPRCGNICARVFIWDGDVLCCDECIEWEDAESVEECYAAE